ncbi:hypothetical protein HA38_01720 [Pantoea allii]|nr:hypothetical protein A6A26_04255 [Pantoea sp. OXWO6B1]ORM88576.1 hypothetical protein HA38_01720 [Pantoea allii]PBK02262.1 hypothetical protein CMR03_00680 [Pantoea allii]
MKTVCFTVDNAAKFQSDPMGERLKSMAHWRPAYFVPHQKVVALLKPLSTVVAAIRRNLLSGALCMKNCPTTVIDSRGRNR